MIERTVTPTAKIGIFAVSLDRYNKQFEGIYDNLLGYHADLIEKLSANGVEVVDFGMIDTVALAYENVTKMNGEGLDLIICNMVTYSTSSVFAPIISEATAPIILTALQPRSGMSYTEASTFMQLENDNICSVPEFMGVAERLGKRIYDVIIGKLYGDSEADAELARWCNIAKVLNSLRGARIGLMGHALEAMYDMHSNPTAISRTFGLHVPLLEMDSIAKIYESVTEEEIKQRCELIDREFDMPEPKTDPITEKLTDRDKYRAAKASVALDKFVEENNLTGLAIGYGVGHIHFQPNLQAQVRVIGVCC